MTTFASRLGRLRENRLLTTSTVYLLANILFAAIPFALLPLLTRYLTPAEYGRIGMFQTLLGALGAFVGLNAYGAAARKFFDSGIGRDELRAFIGACLHILVASALAVLAVAWVARGQLGTWLGLEPQWILWAVFVSAATVVVNLRLGQWQMEQKAISYGVLQVAQSFVNVALSVGLVAVAHWGANGRLWALTWTAGIFMVAGLWLLWRDNLLGVTRWHGQHVNEALRFGVPLVPHIAGFFLLSLADRLVINTELGLDQVGTYMVAAQLAAALGLVFDAASKAYTPWLFGRLANPVSQERRHIVRMTYAAFAFCLAGAALVWLAGPWLVRLLAGPAYGQAADVIGWLALGQAFGGMYLFVTSYIFYSKKTGLLSAATLLTGATNVVLLLVLVRQFGLTGAAMAFAAASALRFFLTWRVAQLRQPMPWFRFHPT